MGRSTVMPSANPLPPPSYTGPSPSVRAEFQYQAAWNSVIETVNQLAHETGHPIRLSLTPAQLVDQLSRVDGADSVEKKYISQTGKGKKIFNRTLEVLQRMGDIVAKGVSSVYPPAELCFNVLSWVISAWNTYDRIYVEIAGLLDRASEALERTLIYDCAGQVDPLLRLIAINQLHLFVRICREMISLKPKRKRLFEAAKNVFLNESVCSDILSDIEKLSRRERGTIVALLYQVTSKNLATAQETLDRTEFIERNVEGIAGRLADDDSRVELKYALKKTLDVTDNTIAGAEEWNKAIRLCINENVEGMGKWLLRHEAFTSWIDGEAGPLLGLQGPHGCGKTFLAANAVQYLQKPEATERRFVVAHVCLNAREDAGKNVTKTPMERRDMLQTVIRALLWQLAVDDAAFLKAAGAVAKRGLHGDAAQLLDKLLLSNPEVLALDALFVLVIDGWDAAGIDKGLAAEEFASVLRSVPMGQARDHVRILVTGTEDLFVGMEGRLGVPTIPVTANNDSDVRTLITGRLNSMKNLRDAKRPQVKEVRDRIQDVLFDSADGNLARIDAVLDNIGKTDDILEIERQLANVGQSRQVQIEQEIAHLNHVRTPAEIAEINELILWIRKGLRWLTIEECDVAINLRTKIPCLASESAPDQAVTQSLMTLSDRIYQKYSLFHMAGPYLDFRLSGTDEYLPLRVVAMAANDSRITSAEINMLKHYLTTVCPPDVYAKFNFDDFFARKSSVKNSVIYKDPDNEHLHLAIRCAAALLQRRPAMEHETLILYAARYLRIHLSEADISLGDRELKSTLGFLLSKLFKSDQAVVNLFTLGADDDSEPNESMRPLECHMPLYWYRWLFCSSGVELVRRWLTDSAGRLKIAGSEFASQISRQLTSRDLALFLFKAAAKHFAKKLFRTRVFGEDVEMQRAYVFLRALLTTVDLPAPDNAAQDEWTKLVESGIWEPTIEHLEDVAGFAGDILGVSERDSTWESQTAYLIGVLPKTHLNDQFVKKHAKKALELDKNNWSATYSLYEFARSLRTRIRLLEKTCELLRDDAAHMRTISGKKALCSLYNTTAMFWASWDEHSSTAESLFLKAAQIYPSTISATMMVPVLDWLDRCERFEVTMDIFNAFGLEQVRDDLPVEEPLASPEVPIDTSKRKLLGAVMAASEELAPPFTFFDFLTTVCTSDSYSPGLAIARSFSYKAEWHLADQLFAKAVDILEAQKGASAYIQLSNLGYNHALGLSWRPDTKWVSILTVLQRVAERLPKTGSEWSRIGILEAIKTLFITACVRLAQEIKGDDGEAAADRDRYYAKIDWLYTEMLRYDRLPDRTLLTFLRVWNEFPSTQASKKPKTLFRQQAKSFLEMLADDIEYNDMEAYMGLWQMFAAFGDEDNMRVAASLIARDLEKYVQWRKSLQQAASNDGEDANNIDLPPEFMYKDPRAGRGGIHDFSADSDRSAIKYHTSVQSGSPVPQLRLGVTTPDGDEMSFASGDDTPYASADATSLDDITDAVTDDDDGDGETDNEESFGTVPERLYQFRVEPERSEYAIGRCDQCMLCVENLGGLWICLDCITNVWLHEECRTQVLEHREGFAGCHKTHRMVRMPNVKETEMERVRKGEVWVDGQIMTVEQWKGLVEEIYVNVIEPPRGEGGWGVEIS